MFEHESLPLNSPLHEFDNITFIPHVAASSVESQDNLYRIGYQVVVDVYNGR